MRNFEELDMRTYRLTEAGDLITPENQTVPPTPEGVRDASARIWQKARAEVEAGKAEIIPFDHAAKAVQDVIDAERQWRNRELVVVVDHNQKLLVWEGLTLEQQNNTRAYRVALLDYPQQPDFPNSTKRPPTPTV